MRFPPDLGTLETPPVGLMPFGGALRLFGSEEASLPALDRWNDAQLWIAEYGELADGLSFFAEDAFGNQFAWDGAGVVRFTAETGTREWMSDSAAAWANIVADDQDQWLNRWLHEDWVARNGPLAPSMHLAPKVPFAFGNPWEAAELFAVDRWDDMGFKGSIAHQLKDVPDGSKVRFVLE
jgi:hypothetical protein